MKPSMAWMIGLLLLFCCPYQDRVKGCSFPMYEDSRDVFFYFFDPGLALDARLRPLSFAGLPEATPPWDSAGDAKKDNLEGWREHLKGRFSIEEVESIVYQAPLADLQAAAVPGAAKAVPAVLRRFAASAEDLAYMVYAKRCEPLVAPPENFDPWDDKDWHDRPAMAAMLEEGRKLRQQATSPFIRDRYAFQVVRLAHYAGQYDRAVTLFDEYFPGPPRRDTVYYWSLALKAGALKRLERTAESAYLFSLVFERSRSKRIEAYRGFGLDSDEAYRDCLKRCRDARERSVVLFLHGLDFDNSALEEMAAICRELPDSPHLEVLLTREIARLERKLHGASFNERASFWDYPNLRDPDDVFRGNLERLEAFLRQAVDEGRVKRADFWRLALGYSRYLGGKYAAAREDLRAVRDGAGTTPAVRQQAETFLWLADVAELQAVDRAGESRLFAEYSRLRRYFPLYPSGATYSPYSAGSPGNQGGEGAAGEDNAWNDPKFRFLCSALSRLYGKQGDTVKNFLASEHWPGGPEPPKVLVQLKNGPWPLSDIKAQRGLVDGLIAFAARKDRDEFEDFLLKEKYRPVCPAPGVPLMLAEQKGMLLMRRCLWAEAAQAMKRAQGKEQWPLRLPDPFAEHALHPWGGGDEEPAATTRLEFARAMAALTLQAGARADAAVYYRLGCALYNATYFGPCWELLTFGRSPAGDYDPETTAFLLKEAARRFAQAERSARDKELAARACFRQADIALKLYAVSEAFEKELQALPWKTPDGRFIEYGDRQFMCLRDFANPYFPRLRQQYAATAYYRQVIRECKLFEYYVGRR
jgi:hypothetical protein